MKNEIAITLNATEVSAVLGLLYTYFQSPEFGTLTSDEQEMLSVLEEKFGDAENEIYAGVTLQVDRVFKYPYNMVIVKKGTQMQINRKADLRAETEAAVAAFLARGGVVTAVKARKTPKAATAKGKNKGAFNASKIFAVGV